MLNRQPFTRISVSNERETDIPVSHVLNFSTDPEGGQVFIHADVGGLDFLIRSLSRLGHRLDANICDHEHLFTNDWSGNGDLRTRILDQNQSLVHHVNLYAWTPEWAAKHLLHDTHAIEPTSNEATNQQNIPTAMTIKIDDLRGPEIAALLAEHLADLAPISPPESRHALDLEGLRQPAITFWSVWQDAELLGCGALKELDAGHGEVKSMRTAKAHLRKGVAARLLQHMIAEARRRGYRRLSLETGAMAYFAPAHRLYHKVGFVPCAPFAGYKVDPNSLFMTLEL